MAEERGAWTKDNKLFRKKKKKEDRKKERRKKEKRDKPAVFSLQSGQVSETNSQSFSCSSTDQVNSGALHYKKQKNKGVSD